MGAVTARARPSRKDLHTDYYCGGDGCSRRYRLAALYPPTPGGFPPLIGLLFAGENFKEVDGVYQFVPNSGRPRGRKVAWEFRKLMKSLSDPELQSRSGDRDLKARAEHEREVRRTETLMLPPGEYRFICPDCGAINVVTNSG